MAFNHVCFLGRWMQLFYTPFLKKINKQTHQNQIAPEHNHQEKDWLTSNTAFNRKQSVLKIQRLTLKMFFVLL